MEAGQKVKLTKIEALECKSVINGSQCSLSFDHLPLRRAPYGKMSDNNILDKASYFWRTLMSLVNHQIEVSQIHGMYAHQPLH